MGRLMATESFGFRVQTPLGNSDKKSSLGAEAGVEFQFEPTDECSRSSIFYSSAKHPNIEYKLCPGFTYWALALTAGGLVQGGGTDENSKSVGFGGGLDLSFNWTRPEKVFKYALDGSDSKTYYPLSVGIGPVFRYSSLQSWGAGIGANVKIAGYVYLNGGVTFDGNGSPSEFLALGIRDFL